MKTLPYYQIPEPPESVMGTAILIRLVDALAFRYRWATEDLKPDNGDYKPGPESMSIMELLEHIYSLSNWIRTIICANCSDDDRPETNNIEDYRLTTLEILKDIRSEFRKIDDKKLSEIEIKRETGDSVPFWYFINGPLADAFTHVGQINSFRRLAGNPAPKSQLFLGLPPEKETI